MFNREYGWKPRETLWQHTLPQIMRFLGARNRYIEEQNKAVQESSGGDERSEAEQILKEAKIPSLSQVKAMMAEMDI